MKILLKILSMDSYQNHKTETLKRRNQNKIFNRFMKVFNSKYKMNKLIKRSNNNLRKCKE
jgi:hypothetical protein